MDPYTQERLIEFQNEVIGALNKSRDLDDLNYFMEDVCDEHTPWDVATDEQIKQKLNGAVRSCNNLTLKGGYKEAAKDLTNSLWACVEYSRKYGKSVQPSDYTFLYDVFDDDCDEILV